MKTRRIKELAEYRYVKHRRQLRLQGIKKGIRQKVLSKVDFTPTTNEIDTLYNFVQVSTLSHLNPQSSQVDEWGLPIDFEPKGSIPEECYLVGIIFQRRELPEKPPKKTRAERKADMLLKPKTLTEKITKDPANRKVKQKPKANKIVFRDPLEVTE